MADLDLTAALEAAWNAQKAEHMAEAWWLSEASDAAVRAAAPHVERAALEWLAAEAAKCRQCGKPHEYRERPNSGGRWTWEDPVDGHVYRREANGPVEEWILVRAANRFLAWTRPSPSRVDL